MSAAARLDAAWGPVRCSLEAGRIPGAVLGLVGADGTREVRFGGAAALEPEHRPMRRDTVFDLASLTKVIFTTTEILGLVAAGKAELDAPIKRYIPDLYQYRQDAPIHRLTLRRLLSHQAGLPPVLPIYTWGNDPATLKANVLQRDWPIGEPAYSDIGFILLGIVIERLHGAPLRSRPLPPGLTFMPDPGATAATERCMWRERVLCGEVHDENAFALGGVAGHAGLFGTADGVLDFARRLLDGAALAPAMLEQAVRPHAPGRGLGWQLPAPGWPGGDSCSARTIGHTGFTGTGLWIDLECGFAWTLLTNRVHPSRHMDSGIAELRRQVGTIIGAAA